MSNTEEKLVIERYTELKTRRAKFVPRWKDIQNYVAITNDINVDFEDNRTGSEQKDVFINDPTAFISTNQAGDYLAGILWNSGIITLEPSTYVKKNSTEDLSEFYKNASNITQEQIDSSDAGFQAILKSYCYDQFSFATSGIGAFRSKEFDNGQSECCLTFKPYGVWNSCIDEGSSNKVNVIYTVYNWRLNKIVDEFCYNKDGELDETIIAKLPEELKQAYDAKDYNKKFKLVYGILPHDHYQMGKRGVKGARYKGFWFLEGSKQVFNVDYYKELPIAVCRAIRVNNQEYGESSGSLAISSIKMLNYITGNAVDNIDKTTNLPLGVVSGSLVNGNTINTSANKVTQFNAKAMGDGKSPVFPIATVGDISGLVNFLIPKAEKDIVNVFKIDQLLDSNSATSMTATESSYRMSIRGKSTSGLISQQKTELLEPLTHRDISIIQDCKLYGYILDELPETTEEEIAFKKKVIEDKEFIPEPVVKAMRDGKRWYKLRFNGELEKLANSELYDALARFLQLAQAVFGIVPETVMAMKGYELLKLIKDISNLNNDNLMLSETEFKNALKAKAEIEQKQMDIQSAMAQSQIVKNTATAQKDGAMADATQSNSNGYSQQ